MHIGSQIPSLEPFREAFTRLYVLIDTLTANGHRIERIDLGGGIGVEYGDGIEFPSIESWGDLIKQIFGDLKCEIIVEPGRSMIASAGILITRILYEKETAEGTRTLVIDAGMNDFMRPALYNAEHKILPVKQPDPKSEIILYDIVGPVCEPGDTFARNYPLNAVKTGDLLVLTMTGAYGASMASEYNLRPRAAEVLVSDEVYSLTRDRNTYRDMLKQEKIPKWLR